MPGQHGASGLCGRRTLASLRAGLLASVALLVTGLPAAAQDATWSLNPTAGGPYPGMLDFNSAANWTPATVPTGTATFGVTNSSNVGFLEQNTSVGGWTFNAGASAYTFNVGTYFGSQLLTFNGAGIVSNGGSATIYNEGGFAAVSTTQFLNASTAGSATIYNSGILLFSDSSSAGTATIVADDLTQTATRFSNTSTAGNAAITNNWSLQFGDSSTAGNARILNNALLDFYNASTAGNATIIAKSLLVFHDTSTAGNASILNTGETNFFNASTAGNAAIINNLNLTFANSSTAGNATITTNSGGTTSIQDAASGGTARFILNGTGALDISSLTTGGTTVGSIEGDGTIRLGANTLTVGGNGLSTTFSGVITPVSGVFSGNGGLIKVGTGTLTLTGINTYTGGTTLASGTLSVSGDANLGAGQLIFDGGTLEVSGAGFTSSRAVQIGSNGGTAQVDTGSLTLSGVIADFGGAPGAVTKTGNGTLVLSGNNTYGGGTIINAGMLQLSGAGTLGATSGTTTVNGGGTLDLGGTTQTQAALKLAGGMLQNGSLNGAITSTGGAINGLGGAASLDATAGTTLVLGTNTYTGGTTVTNATLTVNGSLSDPTIGAGGLLNGTGSVGDTTIQSAGTFAPGSGTPGTSTTVNGNLVFQPGAYYGVAVNPSTASSANVTGSATLGGATVNAAFANGSYISKQYTILSAGSVSGTFGALTNTNLPANFSDTLSYDAGHAYLNLTLNFTPPPPGPTAPNFGSGLTLNQQPVANALVNSFNTTGGIPMVYGTLTPAGLSQASGELATGSQQTTFDATNLFLGLLIDPSMNRNGGIGAAPGTSGYAEEGDTTAYAATRKTNVFAMFTKAPPVPFVPRWSVWAAGYGGSQSTNGNAIVGSNDTTSSVYGTAVGADYLFSPNTIAGFALAGGGTSFSVVNSGSGRSDLFQAGAYIRHTDGAAYISAALAYGWQDITTNRTVTVAGIDQLRAEFSANTYSGRLEGGYRFAAPWIGGIGITPYAAGQFTTFDLPGYAEQAVVGSTAFALTYVAKSVTDVRSELGLQTDKSFATADGVLTLRTRFAWAHDHDPDRSIAATFQALPGASFVVNGAAPAADSALTTAAVEMKWRNGWSAAATFEGEFSDVTSSYAGKGVVRYTW
ncbi:autotransporter outer membrane beta-barrel domain-containing protein [Bradyrhizobium tropiciagri]|uniref:autotransporter outer membrane beta-barrel domain-containing protein n=1 Tax=Bradyrhizobium tropiciagri TaxID=312253 RepID=UPI001FCCF7FA|nr:autotransporter outer membrane beta-barrel domain-containing protein [Bradyrhizobium tropiciagri]